MTCRFGPEVFLPTLSVDLPHIRYLTGVHQILTKDGKRRAVPEDQNPTPVNRRFLKLDGSSRWKRFLQMCGLADADDGSKRFHGERRRHEEGCLTVSKLTTAPKDVATLGLHEQDTPKVWQGASRQGRI